MPQVSVQPGPTPAPAAPLPPLPSLAPPSSDIITLQSLNGDPVAVLQAAKAQVQVLTEQMEHLEEKRGQLVDQVRELREQGLNYSGIETRITDIDQQLRELQQQVKGANLQAAKAAAVPGSTPPAMPEPQYVHEGPPDAVWVLTALFIVTVLMPISIAISRRVWKRGVTSAPAVPADVGDRLRAIETAVESVAVEVERIGEGQRFMSRVFTDRPGAADARALGEGAAPAIEVPQRQKVAEPR